MYDVMSGDYDRFVNWSSRLQAELPFLVEQINLVNKSDDRASLRVLDAACGTGQHAIALSQQGFSASGSDLSAGMITQARINARHAHQELRFETAGFSSLAKTFGAGAFDAVLCLGNSLPHAASSVELRRAVQDFSDSLRPDGLLIIQNRNFDAVMAEHSRWMEPQSHREDHSEWLFLRFYDFEVDGTITFNVITLKRQGDNPWSQQVNSTRLKPIFEADLIEFLLAAGFTRIQSYGNMTGEPFDPQTSGNLITVARKQA